MELSSLLAQTKTISLDFPGMEGFKLKITYLSKEELRKIREKAKTIGFDKSTRQPIETIDDDLFTKLYVSKALAGWEGLKYSYLKELVLLEDNDTLPEEGELDYTETNAYSLVTNSTVLDNWLSKVMSDMSLFNKGS